MFKKVLIANRGEIARRVGRTLRRLGISSVAVYSDADRFTRPVLEADEAVRLGPAPASDSYLNVEAVIAACKATGAQAVHPGYGFLSENVRFAQALKEAGIVFIGPRPEHLTAFGLKHTAREIAERSGVPLLPGTGLLDTVEEALAAAEAITYPVMLKSTAGGGGIGMQLCHSAEALRETFERVQRTARASFGTPASIWSGSSPRRAMWKCRSSATGGAAWWRWASATARSSAATRRFWRRRPRRSCPTPPAPASTQRRCGWERAWPMNPPARWSSSMTPRGRISTSWR